MKITIELQEIRKELPPGAMIDIAEKANVSKSTVSRYLAGKITGFNPQILTAIAEYLAEYKAKEREAIRAIHEILNPVE